MSNPNNPYGQPPASPYGQPPASPYGQPPASPYSQPAPPPYYQPPAPPDGQPPAAPYGPPAPSPYYQAPAAPPDQSVPMYYLGEYGNAYIPSQPPGRSRRGKGLIAAVVVVVVVLGGVVSYLALKDKNSDAGAANPQQAVRTLVTDLGKSDILGVLDDLPPGERNALRDSFNDEVDQLKRLKVLNPSTDPGQVSGVHIQASALTFDSSDEVINDHVRIVKVTGGTITVNSDASKVPYTKQFLDAAFPGGAPSGFSSDTIDFGKEARDSGKPVRIAVQEVGGEWYPSLMYTIVDAANRDAGNPNPTPSDAIPALGASSPDQAVRSLLDAALKSDATAAIAVLDPQESAALHDYGTELTKGTSASDSEYRIDDSSFTDTTISGGTRVSLKSITVTDLHDNSQVTISIDGDCINVDADKSQRYCATDIFDQFDSTTTLTSEEKAALTDLFKALPNIGLVTTKSGGKWYVSPIRSLVDIGTDVLSGLADNDLLTLITLANKSH